MVFSSEKKRKLSQTPPVARQVGSGIYHAGGLEKRRTAVIEDLGRWIPEVPIEFMLDHILPPVKCDYVAVKRQLENSKCIRNNRWAAFPKDPTKAKHYENKVFRPLEQVFANITTHAHDSVTRFSAQDVSARVITDVAGEDDGQGSGVKTGEGRVGMGAETGEGSEARMGAKTGEGNAPMFTFINNPDRVPYSTRKNTSRPDGYFVRNNATSSAAGTTSEFLHSSWDDICVPAEYKKKAGLAGAEDDIRKVFWSMHHILRNDPSRRFTFAFTIENRTMRIYFASRSTVVVTQPFDFLSDLDLMIRFVTSIAFANESELGWDPTIQRERIPEQVLSSPCGSSSEPEQEQVDATRYRITVHTRPAGDDGHECPVVETVYRTTRIIFDYGADALRGRGTRVFEARRLEDNVEVGEPVVIKDVWVDDDRERDDRILSQLFDEADDKDKELVKKYFLTVLPCGDVIIGGKVDHTRDLITRGKDIPTDCKFYLPTKALNPRTEHLSSTGLAQSWDEFELSRAPPDTHRQFAPKVHYRVVFKEVGKPLHEVRNLRDGFQLLVDATAGLKILHKYNFVHRDVSTGNILSVDDAGKLSDLEYCKKRDTSSTHEIRTGTLDFMAVEVECLQYRFLPVPQVRKNKSERRHFHYNPLHDMESIWWIATWILFCHRDKPIQSDADLQAANHQMQDVQRLFPRTLKSFNRFHKFSGEDDFEDGFNSLPASFLTQAQRLDEVRVALLTCYANAEAGAEFNEAAFANIHADFTSFMEQAEAESQNVELFSLNRILHDAKHAKTVKGQVVDKGGESSRKRVKDAKGKQRATT